MRLGLPVRVGATRAALIVAAIVALAVPTAWLVHRALSRGHGQDPIFVGAGDIATYPSGREGDDEATARLLDSIVADHPGDVTVFTAGDDAYDDGSAADFDSRYAPTWGRHLQITRPSPGNHEYHTRGAAGYFAYYGSRAGPPGRGYYAYTLGSWRIYSLNSEIPHTAGSAQVRWLRADLAASGHARCSLAYWHRPRFSSGTHGSDPSLQPLWQALADSGADVVITGHDHNYQRFAKQSPSETPDPAGIREFVAGTGGADHYVFTEPIANTEVFSTDAHGVLELTLHATSYSFRFVPIKDQSFTDSGTASCNAKRGSDRG